MNKEKTEKSDTMENLISLLKRRGFVFQGSEIYGGLAGTWDYAPLGVALKNNVKNLWWKRFVTDRDDMYGIDAAILMNQNVWKASGHVGGFADPMVKCSKCENKFRVDHLSGFDQIAHDVVRKEFRTKFEDVFERLLSEVDTHHKDAALKYERIDGMFAVLESVDLSEEQKKSLIEINEKLIAEAKKLIESSSEKLDSVGVLFKVLESSSKYLGLITREYLNRFISCPNCKSRAWGMPEQFNMMFKTQVGAIEGGSSVSYLRPETAQGMFVNFKNIVDTMHPKLPFGMAQIGKAFRNEIAPRDFIFRTREFEQMEIEYFVDPKNWEATFEHFVQEVHAFTQDVGLPQEKVHELEVAPADLAHYSKRTIDFEFDYPFGRKELYGLAYRTDFDLKAHSEGSGADLSYYDEEAKVRFVPHCIEPSFGVDRTLLAILTHAYHEDELGGEKRVYLKLSPNVAPVKVAVFPLLKNKEALTGKAREIHAVLRKEFGAVQYDETGSIGKRYRKQDEIGTPFCVTVDFETIEQGTGVTVRDRDAGTQERVKLEDLVSYLGQKLGV